MSAAGGRRSAVLVGVWLLVLAGCGSGELDTVYGRRRGSRGGTSVSGVGVLARMFQQRGHTVTSRRYLSPRIDDFDVLVWAPDDHALPGTAEQDFLEDWLREGTGRTLVYIGRDYDAAIDYWQQVLPLAPPEQAVEVMRRLAQARAEHARQRARMPKTPSCRWLSAVRDGPPRRVGPAAAPPANLHGTWCAEGDLDARGLNLYIAARWEPPAKETAGKTREPGPDASSDESAVKSRRGSAENWLEDESAPETAEDGAEEYGPEEQRSEVVLAAGDDVFVRRVTCAAWDDGQILLVTNGSFLLNLPLVNREHRKLAEKLIAACGPPTKVGFLESGPGGLTVSDKEPGSKHLTGFEAFTAWPLGAILMQFLGVGLLYLLARLPIFGRPQVLAAEGVSDFGRHVQALGDLLARTKNQSYARQRLQQYQETVKGEAGRPRRK